MVSISLPLPLSGKWDSNPRPLAWEANALPLSYSRLFKWDSNPRSWRLRRHALPLSYSRLRISLFLLHALLLYVLHAPCSLPKLVRLKWVIFQTFIATKSNEMTRLIALSLYLLLFVASCTPKMTPAATDAPPPPPPPPPAPLPGASITNLPMDPSVRIGILSNGLTYYIKANQKPENRAELRLALKAGSMQEDDDQQGLAHFIEHMAFNGTRNFSKNELINYLESVGSRFGPDLNAYTSFDETVYMIPVSYTHLTLPTSDLV